jgi:hypothetical protein
MQSKELADDKAAAELESVIAAGKPDAMAVRVFSCAIQLFRLFFFSVFFHMRLVAL